MELLEHPITVALLVVVSTWVAVVQSMAHRVIEEGHNFACSGGDGLGLSNSGGQAPVESAECGMRSPDGHGGPSQMGGNAIDRFSGLADKTFPPLILQPGERHHQEAKCLALGHRLRSVPHSETRRSARWGPMP